MNKILKKYKHAGLIIGIVVVVIAVAADTIFGAMLIGGKKHHNHSHKKGSYCTSCANDLSCEGQTSSKTVSTKEKYAKNSR